jgi:hypothetical protein
VETVTLTGISTLDGVYVQGWSAAKFDFADGTAPEMWYIKFYNAGANVYDSPMRINVTTYTTPALNVTGDVVAMVYNANGTLIKSIRFTVQPYSSQTITEILPERPIEDEQTVTVTVTGTISPLGNKNDKKVLIYLQNEAGDILAQETIVPDSYNFTVSTTFSGIPTEETLLCLVTVRDFFQDVTKEAIVPTSSVTMDFHYSGTGVAFGKVAEESKLLDIAWDLRIKDNNLIDFIIERNTDNGWTVEKYASGKVEAYQIARLSTAVSTGIGSIYYTGSTHAVNLPTCFLTTETPIITATAQSTVSTAVSIHIVNYYMNERKILYLITSPFTQSSGTYLIHFRVVGKWK